MRYLVHVMFLHNRRYVGKNDVEHSLSDYQHPQLNHGSADPSTCSLKHHSPIVSNQERREEREEEEMRTTNNVNLFDNAAHTHWRATEFLRSNFILCDFPGEHPQEPEPQPKQWHLYACESISLFVSIFSITSSRGFNETLSFHYKHKHIVIFKDYNTISGCLVH